MHVTQGYVTANVNSMLDPNLVRNSVPSPLQVTATARNQPWMVDLSSSLGRKVAVSQATASQILPLS
ncbi:hypothetical protein KFU94_24370 [Chloroflexi bacterium TSY]|nr:hypothetical protein [Chloroflexi bacterium TSY]